MATKYRSRKEAINFARLSRVVVDVCSDLLRSVLEKKLSPPGLPVLLQSQRVHLCRNLEYRLRQLLYPLPDLVFSGTLEDLHFIFLYRLIGNLRGINIPPHRNGWGRTPDDADRTLSANIDRLRVQRNEAYGHLTTASMSDPEFSDRWHTIRQCVFEIEKDALTGDTYVTAVDDLFTMSMDADTEKGFIEETEKAYTADLDLLEVKGNTIFALAGIMAAADVATNLKSMALDIGVIKDADLKKSKYKESMRKKMQTQTIKLTFIGHARAGKTCLMRQLLRKQIKRGGPDPTNLAELLTKRLRYRLGKSSKERKDIEKGKEAELCRLRLRRLRNRREDKGTTLIYQRNADSYGDGGHNGEEDSGSSAKGVVEPLPIANESNPPQMTEDQRKDVEDLNKEEDSIDDSSVAYVTLFDFGGDKVFYNCHHCIMSANSIYLLVFDISLWEDPEQQDSIVGEIEYWLNSVATHAKDESDKRKGVPPVILIGSHMDKVTTPELDILRKITEKLQEKRHIKDILKNHVVEYFFIANMDNSDTNKEKYLDIWCKIEECVDRQSCWHDNITGSWLALEEKVMLKKEKGIKFLKIQQILELNRELLVPLDENELVPFLRYLHNTASIFCFDIIGKMDSEFLTEQEKQQINVILDPNWIVSAFGAIITDDKFVSLESNKEKTIWAYYKKSAELTDEILILRWSNMTNEDRQVLLSVMENLGLITEKLDVPYGDYTVPCRIVPCLLGETSPDCVQQIQDVLSNDSRVYFTKTLCLIFDHQFVPQAVWDKTVAMCMCKFSPCTYQEMGNEGSESDYQHPKRGFICRSVDGFWNFVLHCRGSMLKLTMFNHHDHELLVTHDVGQDLRRKIKSIIRNILSMTNQGHRVFHYYLHCDLWISNGEYKDGKPTIETVKKYGKFNVVGAKKNSCSVTRDDCQAWFPDVNIKISAEEKFTDMTKVKKIHAKIVRGLSNWICPRLEGRWINFLTELTAHLADDVLFVRDNSMLMICVCLKEQNKIDYGEYSILREIVNSIHVDAAAVIDRAMKELDALRLSHQTPPSQTAAGTLETTKGMPSKIPILIMPKTATKTKTKGRVEKQESINIPKEAPAQTPPSQTATLKVSAAPKHPLKTTTGMPSKTKTTTKRTESVKIARETPADMQHAETTALPTCANPK